MIRIKNTADDRTKHLLHRTASKFQLEPILGDKRICLGKHLDIPDDYYERVKHLVAPWIAAGMVEVTSLGAPPVVKTVKVETPVVVVPVVEEAKSYEELKAAEEVAVADSLTTTLEPAGAPVEEAPSTPVVEEKHDYSKKGPGKKKLF